MTRLLASLARLLVWAWGLQVAMWGDFFYFMLEKEFHVWKPSSTAQRRCVKSMRRALARRSSPL